MQVTIRIKKTTESSSAKSNDSWLYSTDYQQQDNMPLPISSDSFVRLLFDGSKCYIEDNGHFLPLVNQKISLNDNFFLDLDVQEKGNNGTSAIHTISTTQKPKHVHFLSTTVTSNQHKDASDPLAFLFNSSLLINQTNNYAHLLTNYS